MLRTFARRRLTAWAAALLSCVAGCTEPALKECRIASSSMAPTLQGPTLAAICTSCGQQFPVAAETYRSSIPTRCFSCGGLCEVTKMRMESGDQVRVIPLLDTTELDRFDIITFSIPGTTETHVKRIWGLPGEHIELRHGELYRDGQLLQKNIDQYRSVAVPVSVFPEAVRSHWTVRSTNHSGVHATDRPTVQRTASTPAKRSTAGQAIESRLAEVPNRSFRLMPTETLQWHPVRPARVDPQSAPASKWLTRSDLMDEYHCNQGAVRDLQPVSDYSLTIELESTLDCPLHIALRIDQSYAEVVAVPAFGKDLHGSAKPTRKAREENRVPCEGELQVIYCDGRLLARTDSGKTMDYVLSTRAVAVDDVDTPTVDTPTVDMPTVERHRAERLMVRLHDRPLIAIWCEAGSVWINQLTISRDLLLRVAEERTDKNFDFGRLSDGAYFVLGDNLPVSVDSRGALGPVTRRQITGIIPSEVH